MKTPPHIAPVWYFTPYYSILRAITEDFMLVLAIGVAAYVVLIWLTTRNALVKMAAPAIGLAVIVFFLWLGIRKFRQMEKSFADLI